MKNFPKIEVGKLIYEKDNLEISIKEAKSKLAIENLAQKIRNECNIERNRKYSQGVIAGQKEHQKKLQKLLNEIFD